MPQVQVLKYREIGDKGQAMLAKMSEALKAIPMPQGVVGRLHLDGVTVGADPFDDVAKQELRKRGYKLDSVNWVYWKRFGDDGEALDEMAALEAAYRTGEHEARFADTHFRVMQDPIMGEGWNEVDSY
jgi:hypothetical protein